MKYPSKLLFGMLLVCLLPAYSVAKQREIIQLDHIVAVVNNDVITARELDAKISQVKNRLASQNAPMPDDTILQKQILERMIMEEIQLQLARDSGIRVGDEQLNKVIDNIAQQNGMQLEQFRQAIEQEGLTFKKFREEIRKEIIISQLRKNKVESKILVSEQEVENQIARLESQSALDDEFRLAHILVAVPESAKPEQIDAARSKADQIMAQLKFGADFQQTAISVSDGERALQGGDLGWVKRGQLPTIFADTIPKMNMNDITDPVRSASGFHIIKLLDKRTNKRSHKIQQTLVRHILMRPSELSGDAETQAKLQRIYQRIVNGADFGEIAKASSADTASAVDGGNLGWVVPGKLVPEFEEVMNRLQPGEVSKPFKSRFGWHIMQVMSRRDRDDTQEYLRNQARSQIQKRKIEEETQNWLRLIRDSSYVEYRLNE